jgi:2-polyprenyl-3-methyl-5-hydroxy-6-metoxy-1,4-benzoquinol methylase
MGYDVSREAAAFDRHTRERLQHGYIPDLRRAQACDWFYNNPWRRPYLADMVFGRYLQFALSHVAGKTLLEVGCGPGHMALELARNGFCVTGIDLSPVAIATARQITEENPFLEGFGSLNYEVSDFLNWQPGRRFDNICFFGTLHHFSNLTEVVDKVDALLSPDGRLIVGEPARDGYDRRDGAIIALIRCLLAAQGGWYEPLDLPKSRADMDDYVSECLREYREARDRTEAEQSPNDNSAFATEMLAALRKRFDEVACEDGFSFFPRMGGGIRGPSEERAKQIAEFLRLFDQYAIESGLMHSGGILWAARKKS